MEIIHIVLGKANPNRLNGVNKVVFNLITQQTLVGKNVELWGITSNPIHDYPQRNFKTRLFYSEKIPFTINIELKKSILQHSNAVFHLHGGWIPLFSSLSRFLFSRNIKYVFTPHGAYNSVAMMRNSLVKKIYFHLFEKKLIKYSHKIHAIGKSEVEGLQIICPEASSFLLPYGFEFQNPKTHIDKNKIFTIGYVGRLDIHTKGLDLLLSAFCAFKIKVPSACLWIVGDGEGKSFIENFIKDKKIENVTLWGKKFGEEKDVLIRKMHVFAHPSRNEGLPTAVLEAAALGTPSIVTEATNLAEYVKTYHSGIAIQNECVDSISNAMEELHASFTNNTYLPYIQGGRNMLKDVFSWPSLVEKYDELYQ